MDAAVAPGAGHQDLAAGRWQALSFMEQMGNIGSEVGRAAKWRGKDQQRFESAAIRALELMNLTIADPRWIKRLKELCRVREIFRDAAWGEGVFQTDLRALEMYFYPFALAARMNCFSADC